MTRDSVPAATVCDTFLPETCSAPGWTTKSAQEHLLQPSSGHHPSITITMGRRKIEIKAIKDDRNRSVYVELVPFVRCECARPAPPSCRWHTMGIPEGGFIFEVVGLRHIKYRFGLTCACRTFLKRKGGLFKKAHELSVLCSVDVAVIIFGHNKKLYEYSSGDINDTIQRFSYVGSR